MEKAWPRRGGHPAELKPELRCGGGLRSSTLVYRRACTGRRPVYAVLETGFRLLLVNARHVKHVPGRTTDIRDCEWIAQLLECGLLKGSFVPPPEIRDLRDLTRFPESARPDRNSQVNRVGRILELANVKLGSVVSDIMGVTGRAITEAMIAGEEDPGPCSNTTPNPKRRGRRPAHRDARAANPRVVSDAVRRGSCDGRRGATSDVRCEVAPASASHPSHRPAVRACPARSESHRAARRGARPSPGRPGCPRPGPSSRCRRSRPNPRP